MGEKKTTILLLFYLFESMCTSQPPPPTIESFCAFSFVFLTPPFVWYNTWQPNNHKTHSQSIWNWFTAMLCFLNIKNLVCPLPSSFSLFFFYFLIKYIFISIYFYNEKQQQHTDFVCFLLKLFKAIIFLTRSTNEPHKPSQYITNVLRSGWENRFFFLRFRFKFFISLFCRTKNWWISGI